MERLDEMKDAGRFGRGHIILLGWNECVPHY